MSLPLTGRYQHPTASSLSICRRLSYVLLAGGLSIAALGCHTGETRPPDALQPGSEAARVPSVNPSVDSSVNIERGRPAPDFSAHDLSGRNYRLASFRGSTVLINFWATWCTMCLQEMAMLESLQRQLAAENFEVVAIAIEEQPENIKSFLAGRNYSFLILNDDQKSSKFGFEIAELPTTLVVGADGHLWRIEDPAAGGLVESIVGPRKWDSPAMVKQFREIARRAAN